MELCQVCGDVGDRIECAECLRIILKLYNVLFFFFLMIRRPPRSTQSRSSAASDVYKRQIQHSYKAIMPCIKKP